MKEKQGKEDLFCICFYLDMICLYIWTCIIMYDLVEALGIGSLYAIALAARYIHVPKNQ